jgi:hypothetical protein
MICSKVKRTGLTDAEGMYLIAWNIADGKWSRIDLGEIEARNLLLAFASIIKGNPFDVALRSRVMLQYRLMEMRRGSFEEIQQESPFSRQAWQSMDTLLRGWKNKGEVGFQRAWEEVFRSGWAAAREQQNPIQILGDSGDCESSALELKGAPDRRSRVFAEFWYLYYTFGSDWTPAGHSTRVGKDRGARFSVHDIRIFPDTHKRIFFLVPEYGSTDSSPSVGDPRRKRRKRRPLLLEDDDSMSFEGEGELTPGPWRKPFHAWKKERKS